MRILHYSLGFPPYRSGGMTKFCMDLMKQQVAEGHEVALLWPGEIKLFSSKTGIKRHEPEEGIGNYEVINPVPVSLDEGIKDFEAFKAAGDEEAYERLIEDIKPDVIHIHTLMGLHKAFLEVAKKAGVRIVFTAHDFFPICPKVTAYRNGRNCDCIESCEKCGVCNSTALSLTKIRMLQSPVYRGLKDSAIVKKLRKHHRDEYLGECSKDSGETAGTAEDYQKLRNYYYSMLRLMDVIHYNSSITKEVYERVFDLPNNTIISITHADIKDNKKLREYNSDILRIRYLGNQSAIKGYYVLKEALDRLWNIRQDFRLDVHFIPQECPPYMYSHNRYGYSDLPGIFDDTDVLVCPSVWNETFGFTVLEALSYGVPVIMSGSVGVKDILEKDAGKVIDGMNTDKLYMILNSLNNLQLKEMNSVIVSKQRVLTIKDLNQEIENKVYK